MKTSNKRHLSVVAAGLAIVLVAVTLSACGHPFVPYSPSADLVPVLTEQKSIHLGTEWGPLLVAACDAHELSELPDPGPNQSEWRAITQQHLDPDHRKRIVSFATQRFENQQQLDERLAQISDWFSAPCIDSDDSGVTTMEPISLPGLPDESITARWSPNEEWQSNAISTVLVDRDHQLMMIVVWEERPQDVPTESFVRVVNTAWSDFEANNS